MTNLFVELLKTQPQHKCTAAFHTPRALSRYDRRHSAATHPTCLSQSIHPSSLEIRHDVLTNRQHITVAKHSRSLHPTISRWGCTRPLQKKKGDAAQIQAPQAPLPSTRRTQPHRRGSPAPSHPRVTHRRHFVPPTASPYGLANARLPHQDQQISTFSQNRSMQK